MARIRTPFGDALDRGIGCYMVVTTIVGVVVGAFFLIVGAAYVFGPSVADFAGTLRDEPEPRPSRPAPAATPDPPPEEARGPWVPPADRPAVLTAGIDSAAAAMRAEIGWADAFDEARLGAVLRYAAALRSATEPDLRWPDLVGPPAFLFTYARDAAGEVPGLGAWARADPAGLEALREALPGLRVVVGATEGTLIPDPAAIDSLARRDDPRLGALARLPAAWAVDLPAGADPDDPVPVPTVEALDGRELTAALSYMEGAHARTDSGDAVDAALRAAFGRLHRDVLMRPCWTTSPRDATGAYWRFVGETLRLPGHDERLALHRAVERGERPLERCRAR